MFWKYIKNNNNNNNNNNKDKTKNLRKDDNGVADLKHDGNLVNNTKKALILNQQFASVFIM